MLIIALLLASWTSAYGKEPSKYDTDWFTDADQLKPPDLQLVEDQPKIRGRCPNIDYSNRFTPVKDQDGNGLCWGFAASELLEEQRCIEKPYTCGRVAERVSVFDSTREGWELFTDGSLGGGLPQLALKTAIEQGVCLEKDAPFLEGTQFACSISGLLYNHEETCLVSNLMDVFAKWKKEVKTAQACPPHPPTPLEKSVYQRLLPEILNLIPRARELGINPLQCLQTSATTKEFLKKILLTPSCAAHRYSPAAKNGRMTVESRDFWKKPIQDLAAGIADSLSTGHSMEINLCMEQGAFSTHPSSCPTNPKEFSGTSKHAIVLNGMRYNENSHRCEVKLLNSWGEGASLNGWKPLGDLAPAIYEGSQLREVK